MADLKRDIRYIDKDFNGFRNNLIEYSKTYFPNTFNDFTETSTGMLFIEMASYVGDVLSFYLDNQIQETFIQYARQIENVYNLAHLLGYKPKVTTVATTNVEVYQKLPAKTVGGQTIPDYDYTLNIPENTSITSTNGTQFLIEDFIDFSVSSSADPTEVTVFEISGQTPTSYLLKKSRKAISSRIKSSTFTFDNGQRFDSININDDNIVGILDVFDSEGNQWYEVPNLSQDSIFDTIKNTNVNDPNFIDNEDAPYILRLKKVQRRFTSRFINQENLRLEFGAGTTGENDESFLPNPDNVGLGLPYGQSKLNTAFSPLNFMFSNSYGIAPSNTTLTVRYLVGGGLRSNIPAGSLTNIDTSNISFNNPNIANSSLANEIFNSVASNNPIAADGGQDGDSLEEVKQNALGNFQNQLRTVTKEDYLIRALSMPSNLGVISKAYASPSKIEEYQRGELPTVLDLYVLTFDQNKNLKTPSLTLKRNLKTYLSEYRMINDSITIKDAYIVNIGVDFEVITLPKYNNNEVLNRCINSLINYFNIDNWQINQPIFLKELYIRLDKIEGVQTVKNIKINNKRGESLGYSPYGYDIKTATIEDTIYPSIDPMIFEVKFPTTDIKGRIVSF